MHIVDYLNYKTLSSNCSWDGTTAIESEGEPTDLNEGDKISLGSDAQKRFFTVIDIDGTAVTIENPDELEIPSSNGYEETWKKMTLNYMYKNPDHPIAVKEFASDPNKASGNIQVCDLSSGDKVCIDGFIDPHPQIGEIPPSEVLSITVT